MKNKLFTYTILLGSLAVLGGCETYDNLFPEEYHHILTVRNSGITSVPLYTVMENNVYNLVVLRGGSDPSGSISGDVKPMSAESFAQYCHTWNLDYTMLPEDCYKLENASLTFEEKDYRYKNVGVSFQTSQIQNLQEQHAGVDYALPLLLNSSSATIKDSLVIILPEVVVPEIGFSNSGYNQMLSFGSEDAGKTENISIPLSLPMDNQWEFTCAVEVDEEAFADFNAQNGNRYQLLDASCYTLENGGVVSFTADDNASSLGVSIDCPDGYGEYILPLSVTACSIEGFAFGTRKTIMVGINRNLHAIPLSLDMLSANSIEGSVDGTGLAGLFDGRGSGKHFHSNWQSPIGDPKFGNYIEIALKTPIQNVSFNYYTRFENGNGAPTMIEIFVSQDRSDWQSLDVITSGLPTAGDALYASRIYDAGQAFSYFRFCVLTSVAGDCRSGSFFNLGEFELFGN